MLIIVVDGSAPAGMMTVSRPSLDSTVPPDVPIDAEDASPVGIPTSVSTGAVFCGVGLLSLSLQAVMNK
jgi:hypothetical protein